MANLIEFFRMFFSYVFVMIVIGLVSFAGGFVGVKVWKQKPKDEEKKTE